MGGQVACAEDPCHCFEENTEPLCVVNSMLWKSRKRRRSNRAATVGDESELEFLDTSPLPVGTGRGRRLNVFPIERFSLIVQGGVGTATQTYGVSLSLTLA
jgi:hypothetical protein